MSLRRVCPFDDIQPKPANDAWPRSFDAPAGVDLPNWDECLDSSTTNARYERSQPNFDALLI